MAEDTPHSKQNTMEFLSEIRTTPLDSNIPKKYLPSEKKATKDENETREWARWGDDDNWPNWFLGKINASGVALTGIDTNAEMHYGGGVLWLKDTVNENGKLVKVPTSPEGWYKLKRTTNFDKALADAVHSLETFYIAFIEIILNANNKLAYAHTLDTSYCRKAKKGADGKVKNIYYSPDFGNNPNLKEVEKIPIFDPDNIQKNKKCVVVLEYSSYGTNYYPDPNIVSVINNGWLDVATEVPKQLKSIYVNQMSPKYMVYIPMSYFERKYKNWDQKEEKEQLEIFEETKNIYVKSLTGSEKAATTILHPFDGNKEDNAIRIEQVENSWLNVKNSELPSNATAEMAILTSLGIAPSLGGISMPGGSNLSGSGSDIRESRKNKQGNLKMQREVSLRFANVVALIDGYPYEIYPAYMDIDTSETLDENPTGKKTVTG